MNGVQNFVKVQNGYLGVRKYVSLHKNIHKTHLNRSNISVVNYDDKMAELSEKKFSDGEFVYGMLQPQIIKGEKIWVICADPAKWIQPGNIKAVEIDPLTYKPGVSKIIFSQQELDKEIGDFGSFKLMIKTSPNAKYHCLYFGKDEYEDFYMACLNSDFEPVWKKKIQIPETKTHHISDMSINNNGEIILTSITESITSFSTYNLNGDVKRKSIDFGNIEPTFIDILESKSGNTYIGGTAKKDSKLQNVIFLAKLEKDYTVSNLKQLDIADNILDRLAKDGLAKTDYKKTGLTGNYIHSQLVEQLDGRIKLVTETTYGDERRHVIRDNVFMGFGGLIITDFDKTENQFSLIPKFMVETDMLPRINQFVAVPSANSITVFYCDNEENINIDLKDRQKPLNGRAMSALYAATVDNDGIVKREIITTKTGKDDNRPTAQLIQAYFANKQ